MPRSLCLGPIATCLYVALTGSLLAAPTANADATATPATGTDTALAKSADACRSDLKNFSQQMAKGGYWVAGEGDSLGYPVGAAGEGMTTEGRRSRIWRSGPWAWLLQRAARLRGARPHGLCEHPRAPRSTTALRGRTHRDARSFTRAICWICNVRASRRSTCPDGASDRSPPPFPSRDRTSPSAPTSCSASKCKAPTARRSAALTTSR